MIVVDLNNKMIKIDTVYGKEQAVAFIEYRKSEETKQIVTGPYACLPHLDPYYTAVDIMEEMRAKYPVGEWSVETPEVWNSRPEYLVLIQRGIEDGYQHYDKVGDCRNNECVGADGWEFQEFGLTEPNGDIPTRNIWDVLAEINRQLAEAGITVGE